MLPPFSYTMFDPGHGSRVDLFFGTYIQFITGAYVDQLIQRKQEKFFVLNHVLEIMLRKLIRNTEKISTGMGIRKGPDAQAI